MRSSRRGFSSGWRLEVVVVAGREAFGDALDVLGQGRKVTARGPYQVEQSHLEVAAEPRLADDLGVAPESLDVGVLELEEVVLALGPRRAESDRGVGRGLDVGHAPLVAVDHDVGGPVGGALRGGSRHRCALPGFGVDRATDGCEQEGSRGEPLRPRVSHAHGTGEYRTPCPALSCLLGAAGSARASRAAGGRPSQGGGRPGPWRR